VSHHLPATLAHTLSPHLKLGKSRLETLSWLIIGMAAARTVNLSHLASPCYGAVQVSSHYRLSLLKTLSTAEILAFSTSASRCETSVRVRSRVAGTGSRYGGWNKWKAQGRTGLCAG
jgi:hypothetical protein